MSNSKQLTWHQLSMAIETVGHVKEFIQDSGLDATGERVASLATAIASLELVQKHWTSPARAKKPTQA